MSDVARAREATRFEPSHAFTRATASRTADGATQEMDGGARGCAGVCGTRRESAGSSLAAGPAAASAGRSTRSGVAGGATTLSTPVEHSGQCSCRCFSGPSGADAGTPATTCIPCAVQTSSSEPAPAGPALASSGQNALSAIARMASQAANRDVRLPLYMRRIFTRRANAPQMQRRRCCGRSHRRQRFVQRLRYALER